MFWVSSIDSRHHHRHHHHIITIITNVITISSISSSCHPQRWLVALTTDNDDDGDHLREVSLRSRLALPKTRFSYISSVFRYTYIELNIYTYRKIYLSSPLEREQSLRSRPWLPKTNVSLFLIRTSVSDSHSQASSTTSEESLSDLALRCQRRAFPIFLSTTVIEKYESYYCG